MKSSNTWAWFIESIPHLVLDLLIRRVPVPVYERKLAWVKEKACYILATPWIPEYFKDCSM